MYKTSSLLFFFSSRRRHTRSYGDWSSDVCSSDLQAGRTAGTLERDLPPLVGPDLASRALQKTSGPRIAAQHRSEERRVGKSVDLGGRRIINKKKRMTREGETITRGISVSLG